MRIHCINSMISATFYQVGRAFTVDKDLRAVYQLSKYLKIKHTELKQQNKSS